MSSWYFSSTPRRVVDRLGDQRHLVELHQRLGPVDGLGDAGQLEEIALAQLLHESRRPRARDRGWRRGALALQDLQLALGIGIVDPVVEAAPLQRVVDLAGAVRGDDDDRRLRRLDRADLRDGDLEIREQLQQDRPRTARRCGRARRSAAPARRAGSASSACSSGRLIRKRSEKMSAVILSLFASCAASARRISIIWRA